MKGSVVSVCQQTSSSHITFLVSFISNTATISSVKSTQSPYGDFSEWVKQNPYEYPYDEYGALKPKLNYDLSNPLYEASLVVSTEETRLTY